MVATTIEATIKPYYIAYKPSMDTIMDSFTSMPSTITFTTSSSITSSTTITFMDSSILELQIHLMLIYVQSSYSPQVVLPIAN